MGKENGSFLGAVGLTWCGAGSGSSGNEVRNCEQFHFIGGPVDQQGFPDDPFHLDRAPLMGIGRVIAVITQDEKFVRRHFPGSVIGRHFHNIRLGQSLTIDAHNTALDFHQVARQTDDAFDIVILIATIEMKTMISPCFGEPNGKPTCSPAGDPVL